MRNIGTSLLLVVCLVGSTPEAGAEAAASEWIKPDLEGRLRPCCDNARNAYPAKRLVAREMPSHAFLPPDETARRKAEAPFRSDLPQGRYLKDARRFEGRTGKNEVAHQALEVQSQFEGLNFLQAGQSFPPDTIVAASPGKVIEATNVAIRLSNRDGRSAVVRSLDDFFGLPTTDGFHFDPKIFFDRLTSRFYLVDLFVDFVNQRSFIYLAVSRSSAPADLLSPASWCTYRIPSRVGASWADYPGLGMNERWLALSVNNFAFRGSFRSVFVYALDKENLARNGTSCPGTNFTRFRANQDGHGQIAFTVQPAQHYSGNSLPGQPLFLVSSSVSFEVSQEYTLWRVVDDGGRPGLQRHGVTGAQRYTWPPNAAQKGGMALDTGDPRVQQAAFRNGVVWAVHGTGCNFGFTPGESCVRVLGITPTASGGEVTFEEIFGGGDGWFVWMPGIAVNERSDVAVAFQRSRGNMSAGVAFAGKPAASSSFDSLEKLINGRCVLDNFDGQDNRTGDYVGIQTDPADDLSFWIAGEYTGTLGGGEGCNWRTRVGHIRF